MSTATKPAIRTLAVTPETSKDDLLRRRSVGGFRGLWVVVCGNTIANRVQK